ncbi:hypothetical protein QD336_17795 [Rhizobium sp. BR 250]
MVAYSTGAKTGMDFCEGARMVQYAGTSPMRPQGRAGRREMIIREAGPISGQIPNQRHENFIDYSVSQIL